MNYIMEFPQTADTLFCKKILDLRSSLKPQSYADLTYWKDKHESKDLHALSLELEMLVKPCIKKYLSEFGNYLSADDIDLRGFGLIRQPHGAFDETHYDTNIIVNENDVKARPFVCLLYLNDKNFTGGQLVFPIQKKVITPELGKVIIFPATYHFPHQVLPIGGGDRYFVRLNYMLNSKLHDKDIDEWDLTLSGVQKFL